MIEAPEALLLAQQLTQTVQGKTVSLVIAGESPHRFAWMTGDSGHYQQHIGGKKAGPTKAYGGQVEMELENVRLIFTDGVSLRWLRPGEPLPARHQLLVGFDDESCLVASVRMYGGLWCFRPGTDEFSFKWYRETAQRKPQVLSEKFTLDYFQRLFQEEGAAKKSLKAFLATGQNIPGLGNGVLQEILYRAGQHPKTKVALLSGQERASLYHAIVSTLGQMHRQGGRSTEKDLFGHSGRFETALSARTVGKCCLRCGETIRKEVYLGGAVYYCPQCQPCRK